jgi:hypothetical protein
MLERDLAVYWEYNKKRLLPSNRIERQLATLSLMINRTVGGKAELEDFIFGAESKVEDLVEVFQFKPRKRKK